MLSIFCMVTLVVIWDFTGFFHRHLTLHRIPVLVPHAAATAVPCVSATWPARRCLNDPSEEADGSTSALVAAMVILY